MPMLIVSPYARLGSTDSNSATFLSMMAFSEHTFGLAPLTTDDASAYDYSASFDFAYSFTERALGPARRITMSEPLDLRSYAVRRAALSDALSSRRVR